MKKAFVFAMALAFVAAVFSACKSNDCPAYGHRGEIIIEQPASDLV